MLSSLSESGWGDLAQSLDLTPLATQCLGATLDECINDIADCAWCISSQMCVSYNRCQGILTPSCNGTKGEAYIPSKFTWTLCTDSLYWSQISFLGLNLLPILCLLVCLTVMTLMLCSSMCHCNDACRRWVSLRWFWCCCCCTRTSEPDWKPKYTSPYGGFQDYQPTFYNSSGISHSTNSGLGLAAAPTAKVASAATRRKKGPQQGKPPDPVQKRVHQSRSGSQFSRANSQSPLVSKKKPGSKKRKSKATVSPTTSAVSVAEEDPADADAHALAHAEAYLQEQQRLRELNSTDSNPVSSSSSTPRHGLPEIPELQPLAALKLRQKDSRKREKARKKEEQRQEQIRKKRLRLEAKKQKLSKSRKSGKRPTRHLLSTNTVEGANDEDVIPVDPSDPFYRDFHEDLRSHEQFMDHNLAMYLGAHPPQADGGDPAAAGEPGFGGPGPSDFSLLDEEAMEFRPDLPHLHRTNGIGSDTEEEEREASNPSPTPKPTEIGVPVVMESSSEDEGLDLPPQVDDIDDDHLDDHDDEADFSDHHLPLNVVALPQRTDYGGDGDSYLDPFSAAVVDGALQENYFEDNEGHRDQEDPEALVSVESISEEEGEGHGMQDPEAGLQRMTDAHDDEIEYTILDDNQVARKAILGSSYLGRLIRTSHAISVSPTEDGRFSGNICQNIRTFLTARRVVYLWNWYFCSIVACLCLIAYALILSERDESAMLGCFALVVVLVEFNAVVRHALAVLASGKQTFGGLFLQVLGWMLVFVVFELCMIIAFNPYTESEPDEITGIAMADVSICCISFMVREGPYISRMFCPRKAERRRKRHQRLGQQRRAAHAKKKQQQRNWASSTAYGDAYGGPMNPGFGDATGNQFSDFNSPHRAAPLTQPYSAESPFLQQPTSLLSDDLIGDPLRRRPKGLPLGPLEMVDPVSDTEDVFDLDSAEETETDTESDSGQVRWGSRVSLAEGKQRRGASLRERSRMDYFFVFVDGVMLSVLLALLVLMYQHQPGIRRPDNSDEWEQNIHLLHDFGHFIAFGSLFRGIFCHTALNPMGTGF